LKSARGSLLAAAHDDPANHEDASREDYGERYMRVFYANFQANIRAAISATRELLERVAD
jgi:hypothetical protein